MTKLAAALRLAQMGFRIFPLVENAKVPAVDAWPERATTDTEQIGRWWLNDPVMGWEADFNIGVATGAAMPPGGYLTVVDIDTKNGGDKAWAALCAGWTMAPTLTVLTPSGGRHFYFRTPNLLRNSAGKLGPGIDVRGHHGYVVGPGSWIGDVVYRIEGEAS